MVRRDQESVMPQTPRKENVSGRESLVASESVERLNKTKTRNQLLDLASLKLSRCSCRKWWVYNLIWNGFRREWEIRQ